MVKNYHLGKLYENTTCDGFDIEVLEDDEPIDIAGSVVTMKFSFLDPSEDYTKELSTETGEIVIEDAVNGLISINPFLLDMRVGDHAYDVKIVFADETIKMLVDGKITILEGVTS